MKAIFRLKSLVLIAFLAISTALSAQSNNDYSAYMQGAVPMVDGKVVFEKKLPTHGLSAEQLWKTLTTWVEQRMARNENTSRVAYSNVDKGMIAAMGEEYLIFQSNALSLDRAMMKYLLTINVQENDCRMTVSRITYDYEDAHLMAEQQITDSAALYKHGTKLRRRLRKFRVHTIDLANSLFDEAEVALNKVAVDMLDKNTPKAVVATTQGVNNTSSRPSQIGTSKTGVPVQVEQTTVVSVSSIVVPLGYSIMVRDMAKSVAFYTTNFGLKMQSSFTSPDGQYKMCQLSFQNSAFTLQLIQKKGQVIAASDNGVTLLWKAGSYKRLSKRLVESGVIKAPVDEASFTVVDPDGYKVQVMK